MGRAGLKPVAPPHLTHHAFALHACVPLLCRLGQMFGPLGMEDAEFIYIEDSLVKDTQVRGRREVGRSRGLGVREGGSTGREEKGKMRRGFPGEGHTGECLPLIEGGLLGPRRRQVLRVVRGQTYLPAYADEAGGRSKASSIACAPLIHTTMTCTW